MIYKVESTKALGDVARALEAAAQKLNFGVMALHDVKAILKKKGVDFEPDCLIYELCDPLRAKQALEWNLDVSTALPCRISVYTMDGKVVLSTIRPTAQIGMFNVPELQPIAEDVEKTILAIMNESASRPVAGGKTGKGRGSGLEVRGSRRKQGTGAVLRTPNPEALIPFQPLAAISDMEEI